MTRITHLILLTICCWFQAVHGQNQTDSVSPLLPETILPYRISIELANFELPQGIHSGAFASFEEKWLFIAGRTNGLHGFGPGPHNFPPDQQNQIIYVVDPHKKKVYSRTLTDPKSGLTQKQIDELSVTSPQYFQRGNTLLMTGGYGVDTATGQFSTKDVLTMFDIKGVIDWVMNSSSKDKLKKHIRQVSDPLFQVTGGFMTQIGNEPILLIFGQNFQGDYSPTSNGLYTEQVRRFHLSTEGKKLKVKTFRSLPETPQPIFRRRDLNVCQTIKVQWGHFTPELTAFSGVFTTEGGAWTVPVEFDPRGHASFVNASSEYAFKQGMNNYICPIVPLFSESTGDMYTSFLGGISYGYFQNGIFMTDPELPFINQVSTVRHYENGQFEQYLMDAQYPVILSTQSNPGNPLLFGAGAYFIPARNVPKFINGVIRLDALEKETVVGYVLGGIQSTLPNTNTASDSAASPYIFKVVVRRAK